MNNLQNAGSSSDLVGSGRFSPFSLSNVRLFVVFRIFFNARFYYPVFTVVFLDFGLSLEQFAILNGVWAATIVILEVPSGALADTLGRSNLLKAAAIFMLLEIALICFLQPGANPVVFWVFLINRIVSGAAEAAASGADEALAYDSLVEQGQQQSWPKVLEFLMRAQSVAFVCALLIGSAVYDANLINGILSHLNIQSALTAQQTIKIPFYLMLVSCSIVLFASFKMQEVEIETHTSEKLTIFHKFADAWRKMYQAAHWIIHSYQALLVICGGLLFDSVIRMLLTLNSQYYRVIELPTWSFGVCGAFFSLLGFFVPGLAATLSDKFSPKVSFLILSLACLLGIAGMTMALPLVAGLIPFGIIFVVMYLVAYLVSKHLNQVTPSELRATVLSFKGLAFNLAYGVVAVLYGFLAEGLSSRHLLKGQAQEAFSASTDQIFIASLSYFPGYFLITLALFGVLALFFRSRAARSGS